jgi:hypothetical protein
MHGRIVQLKSLIVITTFAYLNLALQLEKEKETGDEASQ